MAKPPFDPNQPFEEVKPPFDPNQPYQEGQDQSVPTEPMGVTEGTLRSAAGMAGETFNLPKRLGDTFGEGSTEIGNMTAEGLGRLGVPAPVSATAGMVAEVVSNPLSHVPLGLGITGPRGLSAGMFPRPRFRQAATGVPAREFKRLAADPGAIFSRASTEELGHAIGAAKEASGINIGVTADPASLTAENMAKARSPLAFGKKAALDAADKINQGVALTPQEASDALGGANEVLKRLMPGTDSYRQWTLLRNHFNSALESVAPEVRSANSNYARAALKESFDPWTPVNKDKTPSRAALFYLPSIAAGAVGAATESAGTGLMGAVGALMGRSPRLWGYGTALGAYANKVIDPALNAVERAATNRTYLLSYVASRGTEKQ